MLAGKQATTESVEGYPAARKYRERRGGVPKVYRPSDK
jgi:hypothetical protein